VAGSVGLDVDRLKQDMAAPEIEQALKANLALADALNIHGTPGSHRQPYRPRCPRPRCPEDMIADARKS